MAVELASAYLTLIPSLKGATKQIQSELGGIDVKAPGTKLGAQLSSSMGAALNFKTVGAKFSEMGGQITGVGTKLTKGITGPALGAATAIGGIALAGGWQRLTGIENAEASLSGLGHSAESVEGIMKNANAAVKGTAFGLADAAQVAASAVAAGVKPGQDLERTLKLTGDAATIAGVGMGEMGSIFNKVAASGKIQGDVIAQLNDAGIPIIQLLGKELGTTAEETVKLASEGKINFESFQNAMETGLGGAALKSGETMQGSFANMRAAMSRLGATALEELYPQIKTAFTEMNAAFDSPQMKEFAANVGAQLGAAFTAISNGVKGLVTWFTALSPGMQSTVLTLAGIAVAAGPVLIVVGKIATGIGALISVGGSVVGILTKIIPVFKALNVVMRANPIGLVITLIAALVAGLVWFFTQTQIGQDIWAGFMGFLSDSWANITVIFQTSMAVISTLWTTMWTSISTFFSALWAGIVTVVQTTIATVQAVIATVVSAISIAWKAVWNGIKAVFSAIWAGIVFVVTTYINTVRTIITTVVNAIKAVWTTVWNAIKTVAVNVWNGIKSFITSAINSVRTTISNIVNAIRSLWSSVWNAIKSIASGVWNGIKSTVSNGINFVRSTISSVINGIRGIWNSVWSGISSFFSSVWSNIVSAASSFMGAVRERFSAVIDFVRGVPGKIIGFFTGMGSKLVASGKSLIQGFLDGIMAGFNKAKSFVSDGLGKIRNLFPFSPAKEGPFSGKGWVAYSGLSIGQTFSESVAGALHDGKKDIADEMGGIQGELDSLNEPTFRVGSAVPAFSDDPYGSDGSGAGARQIILQVENLTVDSDDRVTQLSQALWSRANNADRATGKVNLGGVTV